MSTAGARVRRIAGQVLAERAKGVVIWQARIAADRCRLEVVGLVPPSASVTVIEPLSEPELLELLGETAALDEWHRPAVASAGEKN